MGRWTRFRRTARNVPAQLLQQHLAVGFLAHQREPRDAVWDGDIVQWLSRPLLEWNLSESGSRIHPIWSVGQYLCKSSEWNQYPVSETSKGGLSISVNIYQQHDSNRYNGTDFGLDWRKCRAAWTRHALWSTRDYLLLPLYLNLEQKLHFVQLRSIYECALADNFLAPVGSKV